MLVAVFLAGCISSSTPPTRFYVLSELDPDASLNFENERQGPISIEIASLRLPQYLERPQLVTRSSGNRLELAEYHQWGGNLRKDMIRILAKNLSRLLATPHFAISPNRPPTPPDFRIDLEVMRFERDADNRVKLSVQWRLSRGEDRMPLSTRITELESPQMPPESEPENTVSAMSMLMGELSRLIAETILKQAAEGN